MNGDWVNGHPVLIFLSNSRGLKGSSLYTFFNLFLVPINHTRDRDLEVCQTFMKGTLALLGNSDLTS